MREAYDERPTEGARPAGHSRRDFIASAATAVAGGSVASLLNAQAAPGANAKRSVTNGNGPYPTEGMAAYAPTGPHRRMTFQRRALGPKDVAIKIHFGAICHSDIHTIGGAGGRAPFRRFAAQRFRGPVVAADSAAGNSPAAAPAGAGRW